MAKVIRTVGTIVGVALIAVGVVTMNPALVSLGIKVAAVSNVAASAIDIIAPPKIKFGGEGNPLRFATNPQSGAPYAMGRTRMDGVRIHADTTDGFSGKTKNDIVAFAAELSAGGAIDSIQNFTADKETVTFDGSGNAIGRFANYMAQKVHTGGAMASALALSLGTAAFPGWTAAHELSGHTHALWMLRTDPSGDRFGAGVPEPSWIGKWVKVYDPRLDSTYPGGSGAHRSNDETTWAWSRNPALHALTWCIGRHQNGKKTLGIGAPVANIRVADFVECANVCDTNYWWCGGVEWSTDSKWDVLKRILQAGGAVPTMTGAMIGCRVNTPRVPVTTITSADILDELSIPATKPRRDRFNTVIPRYRSEDHEWEVISGAPIAVSTYVTEDGGTRIKEIDYPLVQHEVGQVNVDGNAQAGELAAYDIVNSREAGPIEWTTGPAFIGLKTGDCVTLDIPEEGLSSQDVIITRVALDPSTGKISFAGETETAAKHAFALGQTATPPPAFSLTAPDYLPPDPDAADWTLTAATGLDGTPYLDLLGALTATSFDSVLVQYKKTADVSWTMWGAATADTSVYVHIVGVDGVSDYDVRIAYQGRAGISANWTSLGPVTTATSPVLDALAYAASRGKMWTGATRPAVVDSEVGDTWLDPADGTLHERVDNNGISIGGGAITIGGSTVTLAWMWSANQAIRDALATANSAYTSANDAIDQLIGLADDGIISVNEKITKLIPDQAQLDAKYSVLAAQAAAFSVSTTAASAAQATWDALLASLSPAWNDTTADSAVSRAAFDAARDGFDVALADLDAAIKAAVKTLADTAQAAADAAAAAASAAQADADAANADLANIASDSVLTPDEKPRVIQDRDVITAEQAGIDAQATAYSITTEKTTYDTAVSALTTYLATLTSPVAWDNLTGNTTIVGATFRTKFKDVYDARQALLNKIAEVAGTKAAWSGVTGSGKPADNATVGAPSGTNVGSTSAATVESGANAANAGVNSDGTIKTDKVATGALATAAAMDIATATGGGISIGTTPVTCVSVSRTPSQAGSKFIVFFSGVGELDADNAAAVTLSADLEGPSGSEWSAVVSKNDAGRPKPFSGFIIFTPASLTSQTFTLKGFRSTNTGSTAVINPARIVIFEAKKVV